MRWVLCTYLIIIGFQLSALELGKVATEFQNLNHQSTPHQARVNLIVGIQTYLHDQAPIMGRLLELDEDDWLAMTFVSPEPPQTLQSLRQQLPTRVNVAGMEQQAFFNLIKISDEKMPMILLDSEGHLLWMGPYDALPGSLSAAKAGRLNKHYAQELATALKEFQRVQRSSREIGTLLTSAKQVLKLDPSNSAAVRQAAYVYQQQNDITAFRQLFENMPADEMSIGHLIFWSHFLVRHENPLVRSPDLARHFSLVVAQREPNSARRFHLDSLVASTLGDIDGAVQAAQKAAELDPIYQTELDYYLRLLELERHHQRKPRVPLIQEIAK